PPDRGDLRLGRDAHLWRAPLRCGIVAAAAREECAMFYAILAYHAEGVVESWTPAEDSALMTDLLAVHDGLVEQGTMGPAARLGPTAQARTLRGPGAGVVTDGPFAETKEHLLGFYVVDCADFDSAVDV